MWSVYIKKLQGKNNALLLLYEDNILSLFRLAGCEMKNSVMASVKAEGTKIANMREVVIGLPIAKAHQTLFQQHLSRKRRWKLMIKI